MGSLEEQTNVTKIPKYIDSIDFNDAGQIAVASSNLTGAHWNGVLAIFNDSSFAPNIPHIDFASLNEAGCCHVEWIDKERLALATDAGTVEVWQLKDAPVIENTMLFSEHDDICCSLSVSKLSHQIVSCSWDGSIKLWDMEADLSINNLVLHTDQVFDVKWSKASSDVFASVSRDGYVMVYDNRANEKPASALRYTDTFQPMCLDWISETKLCVGYDNGDISILDLKDVHVPTACYNIHKKSVNDIRYLPHTSHIITGSDDLYVKEFHPNGDLVNSHLKHADYVKTVSYYDGKVYSAGWDGQILSHNANDIDSRVKMET